jgi:hypothetical protein
MREDKLASVGLMGEILKLKTENHWCQELVITYNYCVLNGPTGWYRIKELFWGHHSIVFHWEMHDEFIKLAEKHNIITFERNEFNHDHKLTAVPKKEWRWEVAE